ncbi:MAG: hypothetical protein ACRYG4_28790, partial [Janthinobacterium lividum]
MTTILDADMTTVGRWLRGGWAWWTQELADLVPPRWRTPAVPRRALVALYDGVGGFGFSRNGRAVAPPPGRRPALVALPPHLCLVRATAMPALGVRDTARMVALEAGRLL